MERPTPEKPDAFFIFSHTEDVHRKACPMPKLTIVIPVHNEESLLPRCFDSILSQSFQDFEVICIDDGSTDGTADVLQDYVNHDRRIRGSAYSRHFGTVLARKLALMDAKGEYVMFADADDELLPGAFANAIRLIEAAKVDILQFTIDIVAPKDWDVEGFRRLFRYREVESNGNNILYDCFVNHRFQHNLWNKIYRADICRQAVESMPDVQLENYTDQYLSFFLYFFANSFRSVPDGPYYRYHIGGGVSTHAPDEEQFKALCRASEIFPKFEKFLRDRNRYESNVSVLDAIHCVMYHDMIGKLLALPEISKETIAAAVEHWGSGIIYDFLAETGMFKYHSNTRQHMVTNLIDQNREQAMEIRRLHSELEAAQGKAGRSPAHAQKSAMKVKSNLPESNAGSSATAQDGAAAPVKPQFRFVQKLPKV